MIWLAEPSKLATQIWQRSLPLLSQQHGGEKRLSSLQPAGILHPAVWAADWVHPVALRANWEVKEGLCLCFSPFTPLYLGSKEGGERRLGSFHKTVLAAKWELKEG